MPGLVGASTGTLDGTLRVGRVVIPNCGIHPPDRSVEGITIAGTVQTGLEFPYGDEQARIWRDDLKGHEKEGDLVAVTWDGLYLIDGFYRVVGCQFETKKYYSNYDFSIDLAYAVDGTGSPNDILFQSSWVARPPDGAVVNDFTITTAAEPVLAPPVNHSGFDAGETTPASMTRALASGDSLKVYRDVGVDSSGHGQAKWSCDPEDYYLGAAVIERI